MATHDQGTTELGDKAKQGILTKFEEYVNSELPLSRQDDEDIHGKNRRTWGSTNWLTHDGRYVQVDVTITVGGMR